MSATRFRIENQALQLGGCDAASWVKLSDSCFVEVERGWAFALNRSRDPATGNNTCQPQRHAAESVQDEMQPLTIAQQHQVFVAEGAESGEPAAKANSKKQTQIGVKQIATFRKSINKANKKRSQCVDKEGGIRNRGNYPLLHCPRNKVAAYAPQEASHANEQQGANHKRMVC